MCRLLSRLRCIYTTNCKHSCSSSCRDNWSSSSNNECSRSRSCTYNVSHRSVTSRLSSWDSSSNNRSCIRGSGRGQRPPSLFLTHTFAGFCVLELLLDTGRNDPKEYFVLGIRGFVFWGSEWKGSCFPLEEKASRMMPLLLLLLLLSLRFLLLLMLLLSLMLLYSCRSEVCNDEAKTERQHNGDACMLLRYCC